MNLLEDIQNSAVDPNSDLATLLRKCKVLAARLGSQPVEQWVLWESNGYPENADIPSYRTCPLSLKGHFSGPFGTRLQYANIPLTCIPEAARQRFSPWLCRQSVASIESTIKNATTSSALQIDFGSCAHLLNNRVYKDMACLAFWGEFSMGSCIELLNAVRNRILDFTLAVWKESPNAGEGGTNESSRISESTITQIFNTTVHNGAANIIGLANHSQVLLQNTPWDFESLKNILLEKNVEESDLEELKNALATDPKPESSSAFGPKVASWIGKMVGKAASGGWDITVAAAGGFLNQVLAKYYGLL